jgi:signal transduction histidine kinase
MKQVFVNLIENSIAAQPDGGKIILKTVRLDQDNLEITVADSGSGINPEELNKIFDLYYTTKEKGNGIGLSIVHKIISEHGGSISVQSKVKSGTEFSIILPVQFK